MARYDLSLLVPGGAQVAWIKIPKIDFGGGLIQMSKSFELAPLLEKNWTKCPQERLDLLFYHSPG